MLFRSFSFSFSTPVDLSNVSAVLSGNVNESLSLLNPDNLTSADELTFVRTGSADLAAGDYTVTVYSATEDENNTIATISFSAGSEDGASGESSVILNETFSDSNVNSIPDGWRCAADNGTIREENSEYGSGQRLFVFPAGGHAEKAFYFRPVGNDGEFYYGYYDDKPLTLGKGKHQLSFWAAPWNDNLNTKVISSIIDKKSDEIIFSQENITEEAAQKGYGVALTAGTKFNVSFVIPEDGDYILNFIMPEAGQGWKGVLVFNIELTSMASESAYYKTLLSNSVEAAEMVIAKCGDNAQYRGETYNTLIALIAKNKTALYHTANDYFAAIDELDAAAEDLSIRITNIDSFNNTLINALTLVDKYKDSKFFADPAFTALTDMYDTYIEVDPSTLSDSDLSEIVTSIGKIYSRATNVESVVTALTFALNKSIATAEKLSVSEYVEEAKEALTDDYDIRKSLNKEIKNAVYAAIDNNSIDFDPVSGLFRKAVTVDGVDSYEADSIDFTGLIKNPNLYTPYSDQNKFNDGKFPGWQTVIPQFDAENNLSFIPTTDDTYGIRVPVAASDVMPIVDTWVEQYGGVGIIYQTIEDVPAGVYNLQVTGRRHINIPEGDKIFFIIDGAGIDNGENYEILDIPVADFQWTPNTSAIKNFEVKSGTMTVGVAELKPQSSTSRYDDLNLAMTGKSNNFDYKEAVASSVDVVEISDQVIKTEYYDINGIRYGSPVKGINIVKQYTENGEVFVKKIVVD